MKHYPPWTFPGSTHAGLALGRCLLLSSLLGCVPDYSPDVQRPIGPYDAAVGDAGAVLARDAQWASEAPDAVTDPDGGASGPRPRDSAMGSSDPGVPPVEGCDLRGRWLVNERMMTNGLGARQRVNSWYLLELAQSGADLSVTRSLACGTAVRGLPPIEANGDMSKMFPAMQQKTSATGRTGRTARTDDGCHVEFDKFYVAYGVSLPFYLDPSRLLPEASQPATDDAPGWEDWDGDGQPGVAVRMSGAISGTLHIATRTSTAYRGDTAVDARSFVLALDWNQQKVTLAIDGSPLLDLEAVRDADESQHRVEFTRLSDTEVVGDDAAQCAELRRLAPTLTPSASQ